MRAGIAEAMSNAIIHGALGITSALRDAGEFDAWLAMVDARERDCGPAFVTVSIERAEEGVVLEVSDPGAGFPWKSEPARAGRGLSILIAAFDSVRWNDAGNTLFAHLTDRRR